MHNNPFKTAPTIGSHAAEQACLLLYKAVDKTSCKLPPCEQQHACGEANEHLPADSSHMQSPYAIQRHKPCIVVTAQHLVKLQQGTNHKPSPSTWAMFEGWAAHPNGLATPPHALGSHSFKHDVMVLPGQS